MAIVNFSEQRGFSLLEVMMALAVAAIALTALLSLANRTIVVQAEQQSLTRATMLAERKMAEVEVMHSLGRDHEIAREAVFAEPFERYRWAVTFDETVLPAVRQVTVTVYWGAAKDIEMVALTSFLYLGEGG
jgi:general secretion pathway protein I